MRALAVLRVLCVCICTPFAFVLPLLLAAVDATPAVATGVLGYEPDRSQAAISLGDQYAHGIAVDQKTGRIYVAAVSANLEAGEEGVVDQLEGDGAATVDSPFVGASYAFFGGVAVNPVTGIIYASQVALPVAGSYIGETKMDLFSATGTLEGSFPLTSSHKVAPQLAVDAAGSVFYPNDETGTVQVFSSAGVLEGEITCGSCPGGHFVTPVSVAVNGAGDLYVVDLTGERVIELAPSDGSYAYVATLQDREGAVAVGVDAGLGDVFVGDLATGGSYHIVAYNADGAQFDDFGAGLFATVEYAGLAWQLAANATTHLLYATDEGRTLVFEQAPINPPTVSGVAASDVGQLTATLNASIDAEGHAVLNCEFQYTEAADTGYADAKTVPCSTLASGTADTSVSAKLTSLVPSTSYRYKIIAENNGGPTASGDQVLQTLPALPAAISAEAAREVTQDGATLAAEVNPHGGTVSSCAFEYGTTTSYGIKAPCQRLLEPATTGVPETVKVTGLEMSTSYDYRLVVTTNAGTTTGENVEFTTSAQPPATTVSETILSMTSQPPATGAQTSSNDTLKSPPPTKKKAKRKKHKRKRVCRRKPKSSKPRGTRGCASKKHKKRKGKMHKHASRQTRHGMALLTSDIPSLP